MYPAAHAQWRVGGVAWSRGILGAALVLAAFPTNVVAVILIEVIEPLTLFEVEGITFDTYSTTPDGTLRIENTAAGHVGLIDVQGQVDPLADLVMCALSPEIFGEKVIIEIDVRPLRGPSVGQFIELDARGTAATRSITDPELAATRQSVVVRVRPRE